MMAMSKKSRNPPEYISKSPIAGAWPTVNHITWRENADQVFGKQKV